MNRFVLFVSVAMILIAQDLSGQWSNDSTVNSPIGVAPGNQIVSCMLSDGNGGALILWEDHRGADADVYSQLVNASGVTQWTANGLVVCNATGDQTGAVAASDGSGGFIIAWVDMRNEAAGDIYAQRLDASGTTQWTANGVPISTAAGSQYSATIISDGNGGAIITWQDLRGAYSDVYAQHINGSGVVQWTTDGIRVCATTGEQYTPIIMSDGKKGAIIAWTDTRSSNDNIYVQRTDSNGVNRWTTNGVAVYAGGFEDYPAMISDGNCGVILTWQDHRGSNWDVYSQRVDSSGAVLWTASGVPISTASDDQTIPVLTTDGNGGAIIAWNDFRSGTNSDIYAQHLNASGTIQWSSNGKAVCALPVSAQAFPAIAGDGAGGVVVVWHDTRNGNVDIYAQRLDASGTLLWPVNGVAICVATGNQFNPVAVSDGSGGAIIAWKDTRAGAGYDLYAQRISSGTVLPVELVSFGAHAGASEIVLSWTTASEVNNYGFEVERSSTNNQQSSTISWNRVGFIEGAGSSNSPKVYSFGDKNLPHGRYSYRLKQIDRDGAFKYSQSIEVEIGIAPRVFELSQNYPNPFNPSTNMEFTVPTDGRATLKLFNLLGQEVATLFNEEAEAGKHHQVIFNGAGLASGTYISRLVFEGRVQVKKIMLLK